METDKEALAEFDKLMLGHPTFFQLGKWVTKHKDLLRSRLTAEQASTNAPHKPTDKEIEAAATVLSLASFGTSKTHELARLTLIAAEQVCAEWVRCTVARGHEPTDAEWNQWMADVRRESVTEQVRAP